MFNIQEIYLTKIPVKYLSESYIYVGIPTCLNKFKCRGIIHLFFIFPF